MAAVAADDAPEGLRVGDGLRMGDGLCDGEGRGSVHDMTVGPAEELLLVQPLGMGMLMLAPVHPAPWYWVTYVTPRLHVTAS